MLSSLRNMSMITKFVIWGVILLVLVAYTGVSAMWNNQNASTPNWTTWQEKYRDIAYQLTTDPAVKTAIQATGNEVKQVTVMQFASITTAGLAEQRVDRCQSCHIGLENPQMTAENIIKTVDHQDISTDQVADYLLKHPDTLRLVKTLGAHPGIMDETRNIDLGLVRTKDLPFGITTNHSLNQADGDDYLIQKVNLKKHPFATFGCTVCHNGSGRELIQDKAHGDPDHWLQPLLPHKWMEASCAQCHATLNPVTNKIDYPQTVDIRDFKTHAFIKTLPIMQSISHGEQLFIDKACYGCHKIDGFSKGNIGPELTNEGRAKEATFIEHQIWDPKFQVGTCVMPYFFSAPDYRYTTQPVSAMTDAERVTLTPTPDPRMEAIKNVPPAQVSEDVKETLDGHHYIPDARAQDDVDALVTFVYSQTGQNYTASSSGRMAAIAAYNAADPPTVPVTVAEGKKLFEASGCYACHYVSDPNDRAKGKGGVSGPDLSWEGARHSQQWMIAHYKNPQAFVPGSIMPIFPLSDSERAALALYDASHMPTRPGVKPMSAADDMPASIEPEYYAGRQDARYMNR